MKTLQESSNDSLQRRQGEESFTSRFFPFLEPTKSAPARYGWAGVFILGAALLRWILPGALTETPYLVFYPAVVAAAALGGIGPGMMATIASTLAVNLFFPGHALREHLAQPETFGQIIIFLVGGTGVSLMAGLINNYQVRRQEEAAQIAQQKEELGQLLQVQELANVMVLDQEGRIIRWNEGCRRLYGYTKEEAIGKNCHQLLRTRFPQSWEMIEKTMRETGRWEGELQHTTADGRELMVASEWTQFRNAIGMITGILEVNADITSLKQAEQSIKDYQRQMSDIIEFLPDATFAVDTRGMVIAWNKAMEKLTGTAAVQVLGKANHEYSLHLYGKRIPCLADAVLAGTRPEWRFSEIVQRPELTTAETFLPHLGNGGVWLSVKVAPIFDAQGNKIGVIDSFRDITERKQAEEQLAESKQRFELFMQHLPGAAFLKDLKGNYVYANTELGRIFGRPLQEILGRSDQELLPPETAKYFQDNDRRALTEGSIETVELLHYPEGLEHHSIVIKFVVPGPDAKPSFIGGVAFDITDRIKAEESLRLSEQRLRATFYNAALGIVEVAGDDQIVDVNERMCQMLDYGREELIGKTIRELTAPEDRQESEQRNAELHVGQRERMEYEKRYLKRDGSPLWVRIAVTALRDAEGRWIGSIGTAEDIQQRKEAEAALRESEFFYRQTLSSIPGMVFTTRPDGYCDYQSQQWVDFTGVPMEEHLGDGWNKLLHPDDRPRTYEAWRAAVEGKAPYDLEYRVRRYDGRYEWFKVRGRPIRDEYGNIVRWFGTAVNINDMVEARADLENSKKRLEEYAQELRRSNREFEQFAHIASHDLQEPLRNISGFARLLEEKTAGRLDLDEEAREFMGFIREGAARMKTLLDDLLKYSRVGSGQKPLETVDMERVMNKVMANLKFALEDNGGQVIQEKLPTVHGNETQLVQLFQNLIGNALKFRKQGVPPKIHISACDENSRLIFEVRDNGIGIESQNFERVFQIFQRLHSRKDYPGTGVGLAICKKIVELHGGRIWVDSTLGQGTSFYFTLPQVS